MTIEKKLLGTSPSGGATDVAEVFSTYVYTGTGSGQTIYNGIDLKTEGGLVWIKNRGSTSNHCLFDSARGSGGTSDKRLFANSTASETTGACDWAGFEQGYTGDPSGFVLNSNGSSDRINQSGQTYASWTFRKKEKFFDVITYTGNATVRTIAHSLGSVPAMIMIKATGETRPWVVYHSSLGNTKHISLNATTSATTADSWNNTTPTDSVFSLPSHIADVNGAAQSYVAYLFADNSSEDADDQMIKCGSILITSGTQGVNTVNLGWEPQFVLIKRAVGSAEDWIMLDSMRGLASFVQNGCKALYPNNDVSENNNSSGIGPSAIYNITPTGFTIGNDLVNTGQTYIYMAIRAPMMKEPEAATDVFSLLKETSANLNQTPKFKQVSNFPVDFVVNKKFISAGNWWSGIRLTNSRVQLDTSSGGETSVASSHEFDYNDGVAVGALTGSSNFMSYMWKRAKGYFDIVTYSGNSTSGRTVAHSLGVTPEMMWVRRRNGSGEFKVYHSGVGPTKYMVLNSTDTQTTFQHIWNNTAPTSTVFTLGNDSGVNTNSNTYVAFLFATLDGISKVGSFVGNGSIQTIDCGFSAGARFVFIKNIQASNHSWFLFDSARGIVSGNDPYLQVDKTIEQTSNIDPIDPHNSGFIVNNNSQVNTYNQTYIFYAIA